MQGTPIQVSAPPDARDSIDPKRRPTSGCGLRFLLISGGFALLAITFLVVYFRINTDAFGLLAPNFAAFSPNKNYTRFDSPDGRYWELIYETTRTRTFTGQVRYAGPIRISTYPFLTHDLLITSGDFSDPDLVAVSVIDHKFFWASHSDHYPQGSIHLLHIVPQTEAIYRQLLKIREGDTVSISGVEIQRIQAYSNTGEPSGWWQDAGCNTITVTAVNTEE